MTLQINQARASFPPPPALSLTSAHPHPSQQEGGQYGGTGGQYRYPDLDPAAEYRRDSLAAVGPADTAAGMPRLRGESLKNVLYNDTVASASGISGGGGGDPYSRTPLAHPALYPPPPLPRGPTAVVPPHQLQPRQAIQFGVQLSPNRQYDTQPPPDQQMPQFHPSPNRQYYDTQPPAEGLMMALGRNAASRNGAAGGDDYAAAAAAEAAYSYGDDFSGSAAARYPAEQGYLGYEDVGGPPRRPPANSKQHQGECSPGVQHLGECGSKSASKRCHIKGTPTSAGMDLDL